LYMSVYMYMFETTLTPACMLPQNPAVPIGTLPMNFTIESVGGVAGTIVPMEMQRQPANNDTLKVPLNTILPVFTSLSFNPPSAGGITELTFTFITNDEVDVSTINQGVVTFVLPGFTGGGDSGIALTSSHITMASAAADGSFTSGSWMREGTGSRLRLTVDPTKPTKFDTPQVVTISSNVGIKLPADGLTSEQSNVVLKIGPDAIVGVYDWTRVTNVSVVNMSAVPQHITGLKVNDLAARGTTALGPAIVPKYSSVKLDFSQAVAGIFATGDLVLLRTPSTTCYDARKSNISSSYSPSVLLTGAIGTLDASGMTAAPTTYQLCYVGVDLATLAGVDSETAITISVQSYINNIDLVKMPTFARGLHGTSIKVNSSHVCMLMYIYIYTYIYT
jgi:hypothetical protein